MDALTAINTVTPGLGASQPAKLSAGPPLRGTAGVEFQSLLADAAKQAGAAEGSSDASTPATPEELEKAKTLQAFESMILSQFLGDIFEKQMGGMLGEGFESEVYTSMLSDAVAQKISESGGLGISKLV